MVTEQGLSQSEVARRLAVRQNAVSQWMSLYKNGGKSLDSLKSRKHTGKPRKLAKEKLQKLPAMLLKGAEYWGFETDLWTGERIAKLIQVQFKVKYHPAHITKILHALGQSSQKPETAAREQDYNALRDWANNILPAIKKA